MLACGFIFDEPAPVAFANRWDKRDNPPRVISPAASSDWVGEDSGGVWLKVHPLAALDASPRVWDVLTEFLGGVREITAADMERRSNFEVEALGALIAVGIRAETREVKTDG